MEQSWNRASEWQREKRRGQQCQGLRASRHVDTVRRAFGSGSEGTEKPVEDSELRSGMMGLVL